DNIIRQLKKELSLTKLTDQVTHLQAQNDLFRAENDKVKQHYKQLYDSIKITRAKHIEQVTKLTAENVTLRTTVSKAKLAHIPLIKKKQVIVAQPSNKFDSTTHPHVVTVTSQKIDVPVPPTSGVDSCPIAGGSQPMSHVKLIRIAPAKGDTKLQIDDQPRKNKSHLRTSTHIDSRSRLKRTVINWHSDSVCQTCAKCFTLFNHDLCVATCLPSAMATPSSHYNCSVEQKVKQVWKPKHVRQVWKLTSKVLTTIGNQWRPTGRIFDLGNQCSLTKFTPPKVVYSTQHMKRTSPCTNQKEPNQNWGSNLSNSPSLSGFKCRSYRSSFDMRIQAAQNS
nr:hypothetical protein [Tanacetum cinerariifolium]